MSDAPPLTAELLLDHAGWARALARRLVADAATADDLVQETWISALREQPTTDRPLRPWLERVIRNAAINVAREQKTRTRHESAARLRTPMAPATDDIVDRAEGQQRVVAAVLALDEPYRSTVLMRYFDDLSAADISRRTGTAAGTIRWRLSEGLRKLRETLDADEGGDTRAWCAALLPLANFRTAEELVAAAGAAATVGTASFISTLKGVFVMKSLQLAIAAAVAAFLFLQLDLIPSKSTNSPSVTSTRPVAAASGPQLGTLPAAPPVRAVAVNATDPSVPDGPTTWHAVVKARFVDALGRGVPSVRAEVGRHSFASTDVEGRLELPLAAPSRFGSAQHHQSTLQVVATHPRFATVTRAVPASILAGDGDAIELGPITLEPGTSVEGTVVDALGHPVAGALVATGGRGASRARTSNPLQAFAPSQDRVGEASTTTDEQGHYRLDGLVVGRNTIAATHAPSGELVDEQRASCDVQTMAETKARADLTLRRVYAEENVLTVTVLDPAKRPVSRARVALSSSGDQMRTSTNADGVVRCPLRSTSDLTLIVHAPDGRYPTIVHHETQARRTLTLQFSTGVPLPLRLRSDAGRPLGEVEIRIRTIGKRGFLGFGSTRPKELASGTHAVEPTTGSVAGILFPTERFTLDVDCEGHEAQQFGPFSPEPTGADIELTLAACAMLRGRVLDRSGQAIANATVGIHRRPENSMTHNGFAVWLDPHAQEQQQTDDQGRFELTLRGEQTFFVRAAAPGFAASLSSEQPAPTSAADLDLEIRLDQGGSITGRVVASAGRPAVGAIVVATRGDGFAQTTRTDAAGEYRFERMTPGAYVVQRAGQDIVLGHARWTHSFGRPLRALAAPICEVVAGETTRVNIGAEHATDASLTGRIAIDGWNLAGRTVRLEPQDVAEGQVTAEQWTATLAADGRFEMPNLPSRAMLLHITDGAYRIEARLELEPGTNRFDLALETREIEIRDLPTRTADGRPEVVIARWTQGGVSILLPIQVDAQGNARPSLPVGAVAIERTPGPADAAALFARGTFGLIHVRDVFVE